MPVFNPNPLPRVFSNLNLSNREIRHFDGGDSGNDPVAAESADSPATSGPHRRIPERALVPAHVMNTILVAPAWRTPASPRFRAATARYPFETVEGARPVVEGERRCRGVAVSVHTACRYSLVSERPPPWAV